MHNVTKYGLNVCIEKLDAEKREEEVQLQENKKNWAILDIYMNPGQN